MEISVTAVSITITSITDYKRRFPLSAAGQMLLATKTAGAPLTHSHGAPLRLVIPNRRGYDWVKWITALYINETSALWQSPLPLS